MTETETRHTESVESPGIVSTNMFLTAVHERVSE